MLRAAKLIPGQKDTEASRVLQSFALCPLQVLARDLLWCVVFRVLCGQERV